MRELSQVFSDHSRKEGFRSRTKRKQGGSDEGHDHGEQAEEGTRLIHGHGWEDGVGLPLEKEEEESEEERCQWGGVGRM